MTDRIEDRNSLPAPVPVDLTRIDYSKARGGVGTSTLRAALLAAQWDRGPENEPKAT